MVENPVSDNRPATLADIRELESRLREEIKYYATKAEVAETETRLTKWVIGALVGAVIVATTVASTLTLVITRFLE